MKYRKIYPRMTLSTGSPAQILIAQTALLGATTIPTSAVMDRFYHEDVFGSQFLLRRSSYDALRGPQHVPRVTLLL